VTSIDDVGKLKALRRARERLETALAADAGWQALLQSRATTGEDGGETAGLEAGLLRSHPLYRAWSNVNAAIEARSGPTEAPGAAPAPASTPASDLVSSRASRQGDDDIVRAPTGQRELPPRWLPSAEEEASVSFVARAPLPTPTHERQPQRLEALRAPTGLPAMLDLEPAARGTTRGTAGGEGEEAEVSVVSVDARRHAGAVERLLRALRGETNPS